MPLYSLDFEERWRELGEFQDGGEGRESEEDDLRQNVSLEHKSGGEATVICVSSLAAKLKGNVVPRPMTALKEKSDSIVVLAEEIA